MNCAIILARSKSKRIKKKNIKTFKGKPLIYWTIKNIIKSNMFKKIIVSTDDKNIAKIATNCGVEAPFLRPKKLSTDFAGTKEAVDHSINFLEKEYINIKNIACFYGTSIFAKPEIIRKGLKYAQKSNKFIFLAKKTDPQSFRSFILNNNNEIQKTSNKNNYRTQDLKKTYQDLGQFYIAMYEVWKKEKVILGKNSKAIIVKNWQATDIDDVDDWKLAELLF